jgi:hypothetical protein
LKRFTGSDTFGHSVTIKAGAGGYESGIPAADLTLRWNTFSAAGDEASMSRRYGRYHFEKATSTAGNWAARSPAPSG